ncbi:hypothetical protein GCM10020331_011850 [Ectobacillus funiculus]
MNPQVLKPNDLYAENKFVRDFAEFVDQIKLPAHYIALPKSLDIRKRNEMLKRAI